MVLDYPYISLEYGIGTLMNNNQYFTYRKLESIRALLISITNSSTNDTIKCVGNELLIECLGEVLDEMKDHFDD